MNIYSIEIPVFATAYIKAETAESAYAKLQELRGLGLELEGKMISGLDYDSPDLPEISLSPAMTIGSDEINAICIDEIDLVEGDEDQPPVAIEQAMPDAPGAESPLTMYYVQMEPIADDDSEEPVYIMAHSVDDAIQESLKWAHEEFGGCLDDGDEFKIKQIFTLSPTAQKGPIAWHSENLKLVWHSDADKMPADSGKTEKEIM